MSLIRKIISPHYPYNFVILRPCKYKKQTKKAMHGIKVCYCFLQLFFLFLLKYMFIKVMSCSISLIGLPSILTFKTFFKKKFIFKKNNNI